MCLFIVNKKKKEKEIQKKRNIKSRKIDKRKRKMLVSITSYIIDIELAIDCLIYYIDNY